jgi:hypothetical protein
MNFFQGFILISLTSLPVLYVLFMMAVSYVHRIRFRDVRSVAYIFSTLKIRVWGEDDVVGWTCALCAAATLGMFIIGLSIVYAPLFTGLIVTLSIGVGWLLKFLRFMNDIKVGRIVVEKNLD